MPEAAVGNFYAHVQGWHPRSGSFEAVVFLAENTGWRLMGCNPDRAWPQGTNRYGQWFRSGMLGIFLDCYIEGQLQDADDKIVCQFGGSRFPPDISGQTYSFIPRWDNRMGSGHWEPIISGPLIAAVEKELAQIKQEYEQMWADLKLDIASMVDPTGACSLLCAGRDLGRGDYLGCVVNLIGVIPVFGRVSEAAKVANLMGKAEKWRNRLELLKALLARSLEKTRQFIGPRRFALEIPSSHSSLTIAEQARAVAWWRHLLQARTLRFFRNTGWLRPLGQAGALGMLPQELAVLRQLARDGYYIVLRACNPARAEWLALAASRGWSLLGKPAWIQLRSLRQGPFRGLVGIARTDTRFGAIGRDLTEVTRLGPEFRLPWLQRGGLANARVYRLERNFTVSGGITQTESEFMFSHYFVDSGDSWILVDHAGRPYVSDLDLVTINRRVSSGGYGPAGYNVGPFPNATYRGADDARLGTYWNEQFGRTVPYPNGYKPFWHGERTGSAGYTTAHSRPLERLGWNPEDSERLVVALEGVEGVGGETVSVADSWNHWRVFDNSNPLGGSAARFDIRFHQ